MVINLFSRRVVGWATNERMTTALPRSALDMAKKTRRPPPGLPHHSDRGSQYASRVYQQELRAMGAVTSMSRRGDCWDNAVVESFFATLKRELLDGRVFESRSQARSEVFESTLVFFNRQKRHSARGFLAPVVFEERRRAA